jgi:hypothetical protein
MSWDMILLSLLIYIHFSFRVRALKVSENVLYREGWTGCKCSFLASLFAGTPTFTNLPLLNDRYLRNFAILSRDNGSPRSDALHQSV